MVCLSPHLLEDMVSVLQSLLGQVALPLHLDVEGLGDVGHDDVDQLADAKDNVLKDDDKGKLESKDLPVDRGECARIVPEPPIVAFRLEMWKLNYCRDVKLFHRSFSNISNLLSILLETCPFETDVYRKSR